MAPTELGILAKGQIWLDALSSDETKHHKSENLCTSNYLSNKKQNH